MSNFMIVVLTLLGFFLVAGLFVYLTVLDAGKWRKKIETVLLPMGFEVCLAKDEKAALAQRLLMVNPRHQGKRLLMHLYRRTSPDGSHTLYLCDYRFASASGKARGVQLLLLCLISRELDLPRFTIDSVPEGLAGKLLQNLSETFPMPGLERIKTGDAEFDKHFCVYADPGQVKQVLPLLERSTTALQAKGGACLTGMAEKPPQSMKLASPFPSPYPLPGGEGTRTRYASFTLNAQGDSLILSSIEMGADLVRHVFDSQKFIQLINVASNLFETVRHQHQARV